MNRRSALALMCGPAMWPAVSRAQAEPMPSIGFLGARSLQTDLHLLEAFKLGLAQAGFVDGRNVRIELRWADAHYERLPALAAELVRQRPAVLVAVGGSASAQAAKSATTDVPIVFAVGGDPVQLGIVTNLARPGGNVTGVTMVCSPRIRRGRWSRELRNPLCGHVSPCGRLLRTNSERRGGGNPSRPAADAVRARRRSQDCAIAGNHHSAVDPVARGRTSGSNEDVRARAGSNCRSGE